jgi:hypothetical protein
VPLEKEDQVKPSLPAESLTTSWSLERTQAISQTEFIYDCYTEELHDSILEVLALDPMRLNSYH